MCIHWWWVGNKYLMGMNLLLKQLSISKERTLKTMFIYKHENLTRTAGWHYHSHHLNVKATTHAISLKQISLPYSINSPNSTLESTMQTQPVNPQPDRAMKLLFLCALLLIHKTVQTWPLHFAIGKILWNFYFSQGAIATPNREHVCVLPHSAIPHLCQISHTKWGEGNWKAGGRYCKVSILIKSEGFIKFN